jgi:glucokinase
MKHVAAIDVGGTAIKAALVNEELVIINNLSRPTPSDDWSSEKTLLVISEIISEFEQHHKIDAVGLSIPGSIDEPNGIVRWAGNLNWEQIAVRDLLIKKINKPVAFGHDVRAGAYAELKLGVSQNFNQSIFIPIGTGIAAALVIDGAIRDGDGYAGEIGHMNVGHSLPCVCGLVGCLETISSAAAMARVYKSKTGKEISAKEIVENRHNDPIAREVWEEAIHYLVVALVDLITILAPEAIIFGGGVAEAGESLINAIREKLEPQLTFQRKPELLIAKFGMSAGTIGTALKALEVAGE